MNKASYFWLLMLLLLASSPPIDRKEPFTRNFHSVLMAMSAFFSYKNFEDKKGGGE